MAKKFLVNVDFNKNQILNGAFQSLATAPENPVYGLFYLDTTEEILKWWNGNEWLPVGTKGALVYKGTVGTGGTVTTLPTTNVKSGHMYMVAVDGQYANTDAVVGDTFIALTDSTSSVAPTWTYIPTGNDKKVATITGDASATEFTITHTLHSQDVQVSVYDGTSKEEVITDVTILTDATLKIGFAVAPAQDKTYKVVVTA